MYEIIVQRWRPIAALLTMMAITFAVSAALTDEWIRVFFVVFAVLSLVALVVLSLLIARSWVLSKSRLLSDDFERVEKMVRDGLTGLSAAQMHPVVNAEPFVRRLVAASGALGASSSRQRHESRLPVGSPQSLELVTVVVPLYNEEDHLLDALTSVQRQTLKRFRCIIVDDASTNNAAAKAEEFVKTDGRFSVVRLQRNSGAAAARNVGIAMTTTPFVTFLDPDDLMFVDALETRVMALHASTDPLLGGVIGGIRQVPYDADVSSVSNPEKWSPKPLVDFVLSDGEAPFNSHAPVLRTEALRVVGGFDESMREAAEDWDCWVRVMRAGYYFDAVPHMVGLYRNKVDSVSRRLRTSVMDEAHGIFDRLAEPAPNLPGPSPFPEPHPYYQVAFMKGLRSVHFAAMAAVDGDEVGVNSALDSIEPSVVRTLLRSADGNRRLWEGISRGLGADPTTWDKVGQYARPLADYLTARLESRVPELTVPNGREESFDALLLVQSQADVGWVQELSRSDAGVSVIVTEQATGDMGASNALDKAGIPWRTLSAWAMERPSLGYVYAMLPLYGAAQRVIEEAEAEGLSIVVLKNAYGVEPHELANHYTGGVDLADVGAPPVTDGARKTLYKAPSRALEAVLDIRPEEQLTGIRSEDIVGFRGRHSGERCIVIGNGPSLNELDLTRLATEYTFAVNGIFYAKEQMGFDPTYYVVEDSSVMNENLPAIRAYRAGHKFFPTIYRGRYGEPEDNVSFYMMNRGFYESTSRNFCWPRFSADAQLRIFSGQSVTCTNLQLAYYMGFEQVILIGVDFSYTVPADAPREGDVITSEGPDPNHFHPEYFGSGKTYKDPRLDRVLRSFQIAKAMFESDGRQVLNATAGGELEVFPRVNYDDVIR